MYNFGTKGGIMYCIAPHEDLRRHRMGKRDIQKTDKFLHSNKPTNYVPREKRLSAPKKEGEW